MWSEGERGILPAEDLSRRPSFKVAETAKAILADYASLPLDHVDLLVGGPDLSADAAAGLCCAATLSRDWGCGSGHKWFPCKR
jgi:hypothetical protein